MLRASSRSLLSLSRRTRTPLAGSNLHNFHVSARLEDESKPAEESPAKSDGWYTPALGVAAGIAFAVPAIYYDWYLINEETQLAACFIAFCGMMYKQAGPAIYEMLEADGKQILAETNKAEDAVIQKLETAIEQIKASEGMVKQLEDMQKVTVETYAKRNETGKIKPLYTFKAQMEKLLAVIANEEATGQEKAKMALMEEAAAAVRTKFASSKDLQKQALANAVSILKGGKPEFDPVKDAYLNFFAEKKSEAAKIDEAKEIENNRTALVTKLNTVAMTEKFYFELDASGQPKMVA